MKGCEGWTWADEEPGRAGDTEEGLLRSWAETQGCTAPGRSTEVGRIDSLLVVVLLELLVLPLEKKSGRADESPRLKENVTVTRLSPLKTVWLALLTRVSSSSVCLRPSSTAGSSDFSPDPPTVPGYPGHAHSRRLCLIFLPPFYRLSVTACCLYCCRMKQATHTGVRGHPNEGKLCIKATRPTCIPRPPARRPRRSRHNSDFFRGLRSTRC